MDGICSLPFTFYFLLGIVAERKNARRLEAWGYNNKVRD
jgi:hypothetical protein